MSDSESALDRFAKCQRCGKVKPPPRTSRLGVCVECEAETHCRHSVRGGNPPGLPSDLLPSCSIGVDVAGLVGLDGDCYSRIPCYFRRYGVPVKCDKFEPVTIEEVRESDDESEKAIRALFSFLSIAPKIKEDCAGRDCSVEVKCPQCGSTIVVHHAAINGHLAAVCPTKGCIAFME